MLLLYIVIAICGTIAFPIALSGALYSSKSNNSSGVAYNSILATIGVIGMSVGLPCAILTHLHLM